MKTTLLIAGALIALPAMASAQMSGSATPATASGEAAATSSDTGSATPSKHRMHSKGKKSSNADAKATISTPGVTPMTNGDMPETTNNTPGDSSGGSAAGQPGMSSGDTTGTAGGTGGR